jgi:hypothetical protein
MAPKEEHKKSRNWSLAIDLQRAWMKYRRLFGEDPHGTRTQLLAMLEFAHEATTAYESHATLEASHQELVDALGGLLENPNLYPCEHTSTHRGGAIWEICDDCGASFADDRGGVPVHKDHPSVTRAELALDDAKKIAK